MVGTWELDIAASTFTLARRRNRRFRVYEPEHEGIKATVVTTYADGRRVAFKYMHELQRRHSSGHRLRYSAMPFG